jgi:DNA-binding NarL/FixJ family response regulator
MDIEDPSKLRALAMEIRGEAATTDASSDVWSQLIRHQLKIVLPFTTDEREYLVMRERSDGPPPLGHRNLAILEMVLVGAGRKVVSYDLGLSISTIAQILKSALQEMGLNCSPARAPALLVKIVHAARSQASEASYSLARFESSGSRYLVMSDAVESPLLAGLAPAQREVLRQILCGSSYADIAAHRRTSYRTVANQVASACQRLGVSGRFNLLQRVATFRG